MKQQTHWQTLGLEPGAGRKDVQRAYRELMQVWHPDRFAGLPHLHSRAEEQAKRINMAFEELDKQLQDACDAAPRKSSPREIARRRAAGERRVSRSRLAVLALVSAAAVAATVGIPSPDFDANGGYRTIAPLRPVMSQAVVMGDTIVIGPRNDIPKVIRAAMECNLETLRTVLREKASPNTCDRAGVSALAWAARSNCLSGAELLITYGADLNSRSDNGFTPVVWARTHNHNQMVKKLLNAGAQPPPAYWRRS